MYKNIFLTLFLLLFIFLATIYAKDEDSQNNETWIVHPEFIRFTPKVIAVLPMDNLSLEPDVEEILYSEVYERLTSKGYIKISVDKIQKTMQHLGIQTPGQISAISPNELGKILNCDALLIGEINQSGSIHSGIYDAMVVSCSLRLKHCKSGDIIWEAEQWRVAHRQWQLDPINVLINFAAHEKASRKDRVAWLVHEMLKTLPQGPVKIEIGDLLNRAKEIHADE